MKEISEISINNVIGGLSKIIDSTLLPLRDHHRRTAIAAFHIGRMMNLSDEQMENLVLSAAIHDIGAFSSVEQASLANLDFESENMQQHARAGYAILKEFEEFSYIAEIIHYHHMYLDQESSLHRQGLIPLESYIIQVADRIAVLTREKESILDLVPAIISAVNADAGERYLPDVVKAFNQVAYHESFWFDLNELSLQSILENEVQSRSISNDVDTLVSVSRVFRRLIDFRSQFTSTHSSGVSTVAAVLAEKLGYSADEVLKFTIAGYIHDIGKLIIPTEILEKKDRLTEHEFNVIRSHTYYTGHFLKNSALFADIGKWASEHHEKLTGNGYPYHILPDDLCRESRVLAMADIYTALTEERPYREGLPVFEALRIIKKAVDQNELDGGIFAVLAEHAAEIDEQRSIAQQHALLEYQDFISQLQ